MAIQLKKECVYEQLRHNIVSGKWQIGSKLPTGIDLAQQLGVAHLTVRSAMQQLSEEGYISLVHGRGTFVNSSCPNKKLQPNILIIRFHGEPKESPTERIIPDFIRCAQEFSAKTDELNFEYLRQGLPIAVANMLAKQNYTSVLLCGSGWLGTEKELEVLRRLELPVVVPHGRPEDSAITGFAVLRVNGAAAWRSGLEYLVDNGHKRIGLMLVNEKSVRGYTAEGHLALLRELGASDNPKFICRAEQSNKKEINVAVKKIMNLHDAPTAIYCFTDFMAIYVYEALRELGLSIPENVSVLGFGGDSGGELMSPALSTIKLHYTESARVAVDMLCNTSWFNGAGRPPPDHIIPYSITKRESVSVICDNYISHIRNSYETTR